MRVRAGFAAAAAVVAVALVASGASATGSVSASGNSTTGSEADDLVAEIVRDVVPSPGARLFADGRFFRPDGGQGGAPDGGGLDLLDPFTRRPSGVEVRTLGAVTAVASEYWVAGDKLRSDAGGSRVTAYDAKLPKGTSMLVGVDFGVLWAASSTEIRVLSGLGPKTGSGTRPGKSRSVQIPSRGIVQGIVVGPAATSEVWVLRSDVDRAGTDTLTRYSALGRPIGVPYVFAADARPTVLAGGGFNAMWAYESGTDRIVRFDGRLRRLASVQLPVGAGVSSMHCCAGVNSAETTWLWAVEAGNRGVSRLAITGANVQREFIPSPDPDALFGDAANLSDGLWVLDCAKQRYLRFGPPVAPPAGSTNLVGGLSASVLGDGSAGSAGSGPARMPNMTLPAGVAWGDTAVVPLTGGGVTVVRSGGATMPSKSDAPFRWANAVAVAGGTSPTLFWTVPSGLFSLASGSASTATSSAATAGQAVGPYAGVPQLTGVLVAPNDTTVWSIEPRGNTLRIFGLDPVAVRATSRTVALGDDRVIDVAAAPDGTVFVAVQSETTGVNRIVHRNAQGDELAASPTLLTGEQVRRIAVASDGSVWALTTRNRIGFGVRFDPNTGGRAAFNVPSDPDAFVAAGQNGAMWIGPIPTEVTFDGDRFSARRFLGSAGRQAIVTSDGIVWVVGVGMAIARLDPDAARLDPGSAR